MRRWLTITDSIVKGLPNQRVFRFMLIDNHTADSKSGHRKRSIMNSLLRKTWLHVYSELGKLTVNEYLIIAYDGRHIYKNIVTMGQQGREGRETTKH